jgi:hypothetical protein
VAVSLVAASLLSLYVLVIRVVRGSEPFERVGVSVPEVLLLYFVDALLLGIAVGVFVPRVRSKLTAVFCGIGFAWLASLPFLLAMKPTAMGWGVLAITHATASCFLGPLVAQWVWESRPSQGQR